MIDDERIEMAPPVAAAGGVGGGVQKGNLKTSQTLLPPRRPRTATMKMASWLWLFLLVACLTWVLGYTVLATHTTVMRQHVYDTLEADRIAPEKAGARLVTYMIIFWVVPAAVTWGVWSLPGGGGGVDLPPPARWLVCSYHWCCGRFFSFRLSWLEGMALTLILTTQVATLLSRIVVRFEVSYWPAERVWYEISKTLGKLVAFNLMLVLLPISKSCFWWNIFHYEFERVLKWHRWMAWWCVALVVVHAVTAMVSLVQAGQLVACWVPNEDCQRPGGFEHYLGMETSRIIFYGWLSFVLGAILVVTSINCVRRHHFEIFYYTHVIVFVPLLVMMHWHYPELIYYMAPGMTAYLMDKVWWFALSRRSTRIVSMTKPAPGFIRLDIALNDDDYRLSSWEPGQWVQINIPALSFWEWHPMSVAAGPTLTERTTLNTSRSSATNSKTIQLDIKVLGNWTGKLDDLAGRFDASLVAHSTIYMDTFYGSSHSRAQGFLTHPVVVILAGGIGATPGMSALRDMIKNCRTKYPHVRKIVFGWCVKKLSVVELYRDELAYYQQRLSKLESGCKLEIIVHATLSEEEDADYDGSHKPRLPFQISFIPENNDQAYLRLRKDRALLGFVSGCGCWTGIVMSNVVIRHQSWNDESAATFQLFMMCGCTIVAAVAGLFLCSWLHKREAPNERDDCGLSSRASKMVVQEEDGPIELDMVLGKRPDTHKLFRRLRKYCLTNGFKSVGVSVCGPSMLVDSTFDASRKYSTNEIEFVIDEETFDW